jgi:hypothetical protein
MKNEAACNNYQDSEAGRDDLIVQLSERMQGESV